MGTTFDRLLQSGDLAEFTYRLSVINDTFTMTNTTQQVFRSIVFLYHYLTYSEYVVYKNMQPEYAEYLMIQSGADQVGFYGRKVRGERVLHLYGLLRMAGILASEIIKVTSYSMIEAGFYREMAVLMTHPFARKLSFLRTNSINWMFDQIEQKLQVINADHREIAAANEILWDDMEEDNNWKNEE